MTPVVSEKPCEVPETMALEREHPEVFMGCVVAHAQALAAEKGNSVEQDELSGAMADTFLARQAEASSCSQFSQEALISEQENNPSVAPLRQTAKRCS